MTQDRKASRNRNNVLDLYTALYSHTRQYSCLLKQAHETEKHYRFSTEGRRK